MANGSSDGHVSTSIPVRQASIVGVVLLCIALGGIAPVLASSPATANATYGVRIETTNSPVTEGETLDVFTTVKNTGNDSGAQTVTLSIDGNVRDRRTVRLEPGEAKSITLSWQTEAGDADTYTARVATENDEDSTNVTVRPPPEVVGIDSCTTIDEPGIYALNRSITDSDTDSCIRIAASNVTLTGGGGIIDGVDSERGSVGITVDTSSPRRNVEVRNLTLTGWSTGLQLGTSRTGALTDGVVQNVTATGNRQTGIAAFHVKHNRFRHIGLRNNTNGLVFESSSRNTLDHTSFRDHSKAFVLQASSDNLVQNTTTRDHTAAIIINESSNNTFQSITFGNTEEWAVTASSSEASERSATNTFEDANFADTNSSATFRLRNAAVKTLDPSEAPPPPDGRTVIGGYFRTMVLTGGGYVTMAMTYRENAIPGTAESSVGLWRHDDTWSAIGGTINTEANTVAYRLEFANTIVAPLAAKHGKENDPPEATFTYSPQTPTVNESVSFYVMQAGDSDGRITGYEWRIDGDVVRGAQVMKYTFEASGTHEVSLAVTDDQGASTTTSVRVDVSPAPTTATPTPTPTPDSSQETPGFGIVAAVISLFATSYWLRVRTRR